MSKDLSDGLKIAIERATSDDNVHRVLFVRGNIWGSHVLATDSHTLNEDMTGDGEMNLEDLGVIPERTAPLGVYLWTGTVKQVVEFFEYPGNRKVDEIDTIIGRDQEIHGEDSSDLDYEGTVRRITDMAEMDELLKMAPTENPVPNEWNPVNEG